MRLLSYGGRMHTEPTRHTSPVTHRPVAFDLLAQPAGMHPDDLDAQGDGFVAFEVSCDPADDPDADPC